MKKALAEDIGNGDVSAELVSAVQKSKAEVITRQPMILAGQEWFNQSFLLLDPNVDITWVYQDGDYIPENKVICYITSNSRILLSGERTALNFLQMLSAVATKTYSYVQKTSSNTRILDSRKTLPNLRKAQKYAVCCGGGVNHRFGLYDAFLIKENHIKACGSINQAIKTAKNNHPELLLEIEVETLNELEQALIPGVDRIMLDNFSIDMIEQAMLIRGDKNIQLEASGNVNLTTITSIADTGVDYISIGDLTKSIEAIDLSLLVKKVWVNE